MAVVWVVAPCRQCHRVDEPLIALIKEAVQTFETLVASQHSTLRSNPEDSHLLTHCGENLKSYGELFSSATETFYTAKRHGSKRAVLEDTSVC
jgi:hypothetical protein